MIQQPSNTSLDDRFQDRAGMDSAVQSAVYAALRRHMLLGESVAVAGENGDVRVLGPEEIRRILETS